MWWLSTPYLVGRVKAGRVSDEERDVLYKCTRFTVQVQASNAEVLLLNELFENGA